VLFGIGWTWLMAGVEWAVSPAPVAWSWGVAGAVLFVAVGPSVIAYRCWAGGVAAAGPAVAAMFSNLTPLFAAVLAGGLLGEWPKGYHLVAFALIVAGIAVSTPRR
jgi:drug/metabolite transporter (DMT)-like permease